MIKILSLVIIFGSVYGITFPLSSTRETCLYIKQKGAHQFQFIVSGQTPNNYACTVYSDQNVILSIGEVTQYENQINFLSENNRICFSSLDDEMKQVSFDIISAQDPLKDHFQVKDEQETHLKMFAAFQELQKVYRDQNMFIDRNIIYQNVLQNRQIKILFVLIFKIIVAIILGAYQLMIIKDLLTKKVHGFYMPSATNDSDSDDQME